jgi:hypothetical protein
MAKTGLRGKRWVLAVARTPYPYEWLYHAARIGAIQGNIVETGSSCLDEIHNLVSSLFFCFVKRLIRHKQKGFDLGALAGN